jgi:hypothetical protein
MSSHYLPVPPSPSTSARWLPLVCLAAVAFAAPAAAKDKKPVVSPAGPKLSSAYVNLQKCENLWKAPANAPDGDEPVVCAGPGGYRAEEGYSAVNTIRSVSHPHGDFSVTLSPKDGLGWTAGAVMEFRLCDGRPFAVIQRIGRCDAEDNDGTCQNGKSARYVLVVEGLIGLAGRHADIPVARGANEKARQTADAWVLEAGCPSPPSARGKR